MDKYFNGIIVRYLFGFCLLYSESNYSMGIWSELALKKDRKCEMFWAMTSYQTIRWERNLSTFDDIDSFRQFWPWDNEPLNGRTVVHIAAYARPNTDKLDTVYVLCGYRLLTLQNLQLLKLLF